ncbi:GGDEF domain-containing protein [Alteromonas sediminis]|uniref:diguanylate cyclase n=1 Tax=Alteromonas sediminis TaxID=2259342 RepID=A0A3N5Y379_9ALTE|nr:GGDEF domain-containing protein [Alteromonas sediminis]RPJ68322.1 GGDEF domain-containing protein [Alteromonas sediminis]
MDKKKQQALTKYADQLAQLIMRLSAFYEGAHPAIDNELKILKGHLAGTPNFTLAEISIGKVNALLMDGGQHIPKRITSAISELKKQLKAIQQLDGASTTIRQLAAKQLGTLSLPTASLGLLFEHLFNAISLAQVAIDKSDGANNEAYNNYASESLQEGQTFDELPEEIRAEITTELQQLIDVYSRKKPQDTTLQSIKSALEKGIDDKQLLETCLIVIRFIISETMMDASTSGKLVQNFTNTITKVNTQVDETKSLSQKNFDKQAQQQADLQDMLGDLDNDIDDGNDVEALKEKAHKQISKMREAIDNQQTSGEKDQQVLMDLLNDMQNQLHSLQRKTESYKKRLFEQRATIYTDPLTKVPNRLAYNEKVLKAIQQAQTTEQPLCLAIVDVDRFKSINDQYGHAAGDRTLQVIANHFKKCLQPNEFVARWGGEEFVILMHNQAKDGLFDRLEKIRLSLSELPFKFKQTPVKITASFGACCFAEDETAQQAFERADAALYKAKNQGRNCVVLSE